MTQSKPPPRPLVLLLSPIVAVMLLVGVRALGDGVKVTNDAVPPTEPQVVQFDAPDAGAPVATQESPAVASSDGGAPGDAMEADADDSDSPDDESAAQFDGKIPNIGALAEYPSAKNLLALAELGDDGRYSSMQDGKKVPLTLDSDLQQRIEALLRTYAPPYAAVAAIEPATGRVLAMAQYSRDPKAQALGLRAAYPAASVFKMVTAAALLEHGVDPDKEVCFHGGHHRIQPKLLADNGRDSQCYDMTEAMAKSANVVFAKLAHKYLKPEDLRGEASRFGFNRDLVFDQPVERSGANIPDEEFPFATTAAGFGQVFLSPLHGALMAATVGMGGMMPTPFLVDDGREPSAPKRVVEGKVASQLAEMMSETISSGTARRAFHERGRDVLKGIDVAGKTGSLDDRKPFHDYTWFVGFAPRDKPTIAVAAVVVNDLIWRVRAPYVARESLRYFLQPSGPSPKAHHRIQARAAAAVARSSK